MAMTFAALFLCGTAGVCDVSRHCMAALASSEIVCVLVTKVVAGNNSGTVLYATFGFALRLMPKFTIDTNSPRCISVLTFSSFILGMFAPPTSKPGNVAA